jgi:hypothetical protein
MSPDLASLPKPMPVFTSPVTSEPDQNAFSESLKTAMNGFDAGGPDLDDGSDLDPDASIGPALLDKLSALSKADQTQMAEIRKPIEGMKATGLEANGTDDDSNEIGAPPVIGDSKGLQSTTDVLQQIIKKAGEDAAATLSREAEITAAGNVNSVVHTLTSQQ